MLKYYIFKNFIYIYFVSYTRVVSCNKEENTNTTWNQSRVFCVRVFFMSCTSNLNRNTKFSCHFVSFGRVVSKVAGSSFYFLIMCWFYGVDLEVTQLFWVSYGSTLKYTRKSETTMFWLWFVFRGSTSCWVDLAPQTKQLCQFTECYIIIFHK